MSAERFQSLSMLLLLAGLIVAGLGGVGTYYFGLKSAQEREDRENQHERELRQRLSKVEQTNQQLLAQANLGWSSLPPVAEAPAPASTPAPANTTSERAVAPAKVVMGTVSPMPAITPVKVTAPPLANAQKSISPAPVSSETKSAPGRDLSENQRKKILGTLGKHAGKSITICASGSDSECIAFAGKLKGAFVEAGWHVDGVKKVAYAKPPVGLSMAAGTFPSPEGMTAACKALADAGYNVSQQLDSRLTGGQSELIVGPER